MTQILENKVAIVTGGAKGIGAAISEALAAAGATVVIADIDQAGAEATAAGIDNAEGVAVDVRDEAQVKGLVDDTVAKHGHLDVLVCNAGIAAIQPLTETSLEDWRNVLSINLDGVFLCVKHAAPAMVANGGGSIINIASIKAFGGSPVTGHYGAAKAGVVSLTKTAALELRDHGVRVNAICPGWIETDMVLDRQEEFLNVTGMTLNDMVTQLQGRLGKPEEIAGLAVFLASDRARFASGTAYIADGGATASIP
jgi:NAD(P)-dependent dehydrogenase (short-subunit alcohol dehydrogenase family)